MYVPVFFRGQHTHAFVTLYGREKRKKHLLLLHGIGSTGQESFQNIAPYLSLQYQLIVPDWIGFGRSARLLGPSDSYDAAYCAEWLFSFVVECKKSGILTSGYHLVAHSMSAIALAYSYESLHESIGKIILVNPAGFDRRINAAFAFILTNRIFSQHRAARIMANKFVWRRILGWSEKHRMRLIEGLTNGELEILTRYAKSGIHPWGVMKPSHVVPQRLASMECPVMLLHSTNDHIFYQRDYLQYATRAGWPVCIIPFYDHNIITRRPAECAEAISRFLAE